MSLLRTIYYTPMDDDEEASSSVEEEADIGGETTPPEEIPENAVEDVTKGCFGTLLLFLLEIGLFILGIKLLLYVAGTR